MPANISHNDMLCDQCFTPVRGYLYNVLTECDEDGKKTDETYRHKYCGQVPAELRKANANDVMRDEHYRRRMSLETAERDEGLWRARE